MRERVRAGQAERVPAMRVTHVQADGEQPCGEPRAARPLVQQPGERQGSGARPVHPAPSGRDARMPFACRRPIVERGLFDTPDVQAQQRPRSI